MLPEGKKHFGKRRGKEVRGSFTAGKTNGNGFRPDAGPGLPGDILKKKKEEEEQNVTQK